MLKMKESSAELSDEIDMQCAAVGIPQGVSATSFRCKFKESFTGG